MLKNKTFERQGQEERFREQCTPYIHRGVTGAFQMPGVDKGMWLHHSMCMAFWTRNGTHVYLVGH